VNYYKEIKTRISWLLFGLALSLGIAEVIKGFEDTLAENLILASFIPLVVYMSDAVGTQMESIIIRELNKKGKFNFSIFLRQQIAIVLVVALVVGIVGGVAVALLNGSPDLGVVIGGSLIGSIVSSLITGSVLPYLFWKSHNDPAEASGPVATAIQDFLSVVIFFLIAQAML
jgi:magnesium transporter